MASVDLRCALMIGSTSSTLRTSTQRAPYDVKCFSMRTCAGARRAPPVFISSKARRPTGTGSVPT